MVMGLRRFMGWLIIHFARACRLVKLGLSQTDGDSYDLLSDELDAWNECHTDTAPRVLNGARLIALHEQALRQALGELGFLVIESLRLR